MRFLDKWVHFFHDVCIVCACMHTLICMFVCKYAFHDNHKGSEYNDSEDEYNLQEHKHHQR